MQSARTTAPTASAPDERMGHSVCNGDDPEICLFLPRGFAHVFARMALRANSSQKSVGHSSSNVPRRWHTYTQRDITITSALQNERNCGGERHSFSEAVSVGQRTSFSYVDS